METVDLITFILALAIVTGAGLAEIIAILKRKKGEEDQ